MQNYSPINILFVCLGNICRSPLAQGLMDDLISKNNLQEYVTTDSAGTGSWHIGSSPDSRTLKNALSHNIHLPYFARQVCVKDFDIFDYIIAMDQQNLDNLRKICPPQSKSKLFKIRDFDSTNIGSNVPDPYYGTEGDFENVFQILSHSVSSFYQVEISPKLSINNRIV
jgi:protein-tyrosine phosphatase